MFPTSFIQRICWSRSLSTSVVVHSNKETNLEFMRKLLGCNNKTWDDQANSFLEKYDRNNLQDSYNTLKKLGFSDSDIQSELRVLCFHSQTLTSRHRIYCDYCFHKRLISPTLLRRFVRTAALNIFDLKREGYIDKYRNVLVHIDKKWKLNTEHLQETMPLKTIHYECSLLYLMNTLCISYDEAKYHYKKYPNLRARSLRCIRENVSTLTRRFGFDIEKIKKHIYVLYADKDNMLALLKTFNKRSSIDIKQLVYSYPNILLSRVSNVQGVIQCIQKYGYTPEQISKAPMLLLLNPSTIERRLSHLHNEAWFQPYVGLPRALMLVFTLPGVGRRRKILDELNMKCVSINTLSCTGITFNSYTKHGRDKLNSVDGFNYLSGKLNVSFHQVMDKLRSHPYKRYVSLQQIHNSLTYLQEKFSEEDIFQNLQLVLYPVHVIESALTKVQDPSCSLVDTTPCQDPASGTLRHQFILPLALYLIEKENNFSGYGVWEEEEGGTSTDGVEVPMLPIRKKRGRKPWTS